MVPGATNTGMTCDNCGEPLGSWDPLDPTHIWCGNCRMRANQIRETARNQFKVFGEMLRKVRESKEKGDKND